MRASSMLCALSSLFIIFFPSPTAAFYKYDSSFAFLNVRRKGLSPAEGLDFCVNFQQWRNRQLPASADSKNFFQIGWWNRTLNTNICLENGHNFAKNELVPADYRTLSRELSACKFQRGEAIINATLNRLRPKGVRYVLFLVEEGKRNSYGTHDFLFSQFYNAEINDSDPSVSVLYIYNDTFQLKIKPLLSNSSAAELRFYRPQSAWPMDPAVAFLWLFAVGSILIGSLWAAFESKTSLEQRVPPFDSQSEGLGASRTALSEEEQANGPTISGSHLKRSQSVEFAQMNVRQHLSVVLASLVFIVVVLTLSYFFRKIAVLGFCVLLWFLGICSVHGCVYAFLKTFLGEKTLPSLRNCWGGQKKDLQNECCSENEATPPHPTDFANVGPQATTAVSIPSSDYPPSVAFPTTTTSRKSVVSPLDRPINLLSSIVFLFAVLFCTVWFVYREHYNAFYLLDTINIMVCIFAVKGSRCRSLRLLTFLLLAMFAYDLFMVFGTTLLTTDGCSVMMEVVTGVDCQQKRAESASAAGKNYQPVAPVDLEDVPEKIPLLFYVPMLADPMSRCFDVQVEREYKRVMLGLGDVIIPGYLIAFGFYVDVVKRSRFYTYGSLSIIGYSLGMFGTFVALLLMETGQPALIYLVPFTLGPIFAWALFVDGNGIFGQMWRGEL